MRSTESTIRFSHPFRLSQLDQAQPTGHYRLVTEEEQLELTCRSQNWCTCGRAPPSHSEASQRARGGRGGSRRDRRGRGRRRPARLPQRRARLAPAAARIMAALWRDRRHPPHRAPHQTVATRTNFISTISCSCWQCRPAAARHASIGTDLAAVEAAWISAAGESWAGGSLVSHKREVGRRHPRRWPNSGPSRGSQELGDYADFLHAGLHLPELHGRATAGRIISWDERDPRPPFCLLAQLVVPARAMSSSLATNTRDQRAAVARDPRSPSGSSPWDSSEARLPPDHTVLELHRVPGPAARPARVAATICSVVCGRLLVRPGSRTKQTCRPVSGPARSSRRPRRVEPDHRSRTLSLPPELLKTHLLADTQRGPGRLEQFQGSPSPAPDVGSSTPNSRSNVQFVRRFLKRRDRATPRAGGCFDVRSLREGEPGPRARDTSPLPIETRREPTARKDQERQGKAQHRTAPQPFEEYSKPFATRRAPPLGAAGRARRRR